jgi:TetR/AcrR family transcriptional regulator, transcriptional repressor for nem operon
MPRKATDTKERIVHTATNLFSSHGYTATAIDDVISAVGITKGAFYHYFNSKEHLCEIVITEAVWSYRQLADNVQESDPPAERLNLWLRRLMERQTSGEWLYCRLLGRLSIESHALGTSAQNGLKSFWLWCQGHYETLIRAAQKNRSGAASSEPADLARLFMAAHFGAMWLDDIAPVSEDMFRVCETLLKLTGSSKA